MKWIGQHIYDQISRFRNDVYLEDISASTETDMLVVDSSGKVSKRAIDAITVDVSDFMTNGVNNRVLTATGTDAINAEANLTFDGSTLNIGSGASTSDALFIDTNNLTTGSAIFIDVDDALTTASSNSLVKVDYDKSGVTGSGLTNTTTGLELTFHDAVTNHTSSTVIYNGVRVVADSASNQGAIHQTGFSAILTDADVANTIGFYSLVEDGGIDFKAASTADTGDYFTIATTTNGATTLTTVDDDATAAHMTMEADGDIRLKPATGILRFMDSDNAADYTSVELGSHGDLKLTTRDIAATAAHFEIEADGNITLDAAGDIALEGDTTITGDLEVSGFVRENLVFERIIGDTLTISQGVNHDTAITTVDSDLDIVVDGNLELDASGTMALNANTISSSAAAFYFSGSTYAGTPLMQLTNQVNDASGPTFSFTNLRDGNGLEDGDTLGSIQFIGEDAVGAAETYGSIIASVVEADHGDEAGQIAITVANDGTERNGITMTADKGTATEVDVTIANGTASTTTIAGTLTMGSTATLNSAGILQTAAQTNITSLGALTALDVDDINLNGKTLTITGDTNDTFSIATGAAGATTLTTVDTDAVAAHFSIVADGNITLNATADIALVATGNDVTVDTDNFVIESAGVSAPDLTLLSTSNHVTGSNFIFTKQRADNTPADGDIIGTVTFQGEDDGGENQVYASIAGLSEETGDGEEGGKLKFDVASHDGELQTGLLIEDGNAEDEIDVTIANGAASVTTVAGTLTMGSTAALTNAGLLSVAAQANITSLGTLTALDVDNININGDTITASGDMALVATGNDISVDTDNFVIESATSHLPILEIKSTNDNGDGGKLIFHKDRASTVVNDDVMGAIGWSGDNDAGEAITYAWIEVSALEVDDTDEAGRMKLQVAESNGSNTNVTTGLLIEGSDNTTDGEVNVTIAAGAASTTTIAGDLIVTGTTISSPGRLRLVPAPGNDILFDGGISLDGDVIENIGTLKLNGVGGTIELGHASDTTLARSAAGVVTIEGNQIVTDGSVNVASGASAPIAMRVARRTITQAEMNALHTTPIEIIPAPGANKIIIINSGGNFIMADRAATNTATSTLGIGFDGFTESFSTLYNRRFMNSTTTDTLFNLGGYQSKSATVLTDGVNKKVEAKFFGACTNNCFTSVDVVISYYILDLS